MWIWSNNWQTLGKEILQADVTFGAEARAMEQNVFGGSSLISLPG